MKLLNERIVKVAIVFLAVVLLVIFQSFFSLMKSEFHALQENEVDQYISAVESSIKNVYDFTDDYEHVLNERMYYLSRNVRFSMKNASYGDLSHEDLVALKNEYGVEGISIFVPDGKAFRIVSSSDKNEAGSKTDDWGYWNGVFKDLFAKRKIASGKGESFGNEFWVGPRTRSYSQDGYMRYSYISSDDGKYLIDVFVNDNALDKYIHSGHVESLMNSINKEVKGIDQIAVLSAKRWRASLDSVKTGNRDPYVIYGRFNTQVISDHGITPEKVLASKKISYSVDDKGKRHILFAMDKDNIVAMRVNSGMLDRLLGIIKYTFAGLAFATVVVIAGSGYFLVRKYSGILEIEKKRSEIATAFQKTIKEMPDMIYHCRIDDSGNVVVTYNDGKIIDDRDVIIEPGSSKIMDDVFGTGYCEHVKLHLMESFAGKRTRFEATYMGRVCDHIVSPLVDLGVDASTGKMNEILVMANDISARVEKEKNVEKMARTDILTQIPNRLGFKEHFDKRISSIDPDAPAYLMYMDLDGFKAINDNLGHNVGDDVLKAVARSLVDISDENAFFARLGGDEFVGWVESRTHDELSNLIQGIRKSISHIGDEYDGCSIGVSIGFAEYPHDSARYDELLSIADKSMYFQKRLRAQNE